MDQGFFDPGRLYRRPKEDAAPGHQELFWVIHVATPPGGFAAPGHEHPVAFGWRRTTTPNGHTTPLGPYTAHTRDGWQDVTDSDLAHALGLTDTRAGGWRSATTPQGDVPAPGRPGGRRATDPPAPQDDRPHRIARLLHPHRHRPNRPPHPPTGR
ncbi:hypothetical protein GCM10010441_75400 [Kitasatospora paracochleata]|uniref:Uncharacterized protein n=1 Tax=Kitasatospora paracochleata TaxID=58354 RepID=A0ABT1JA59_9ACTN|nr:hypothetical protein [Kitasatospora paracochleata]MCP2314253.1 hypothetical protein [Kitasatospora paracochleata]